ncbi:MAG: protein translocase subunit SecD [Christensenellales bacterium]
MNKRKKSIAWLAVILAALCAFGFFALNGITIGRVTVKPLASAIKQGLDLTGGVSAVYEAVNKDDPNLQENLGAVMAVFRTRLDAEGYTEATVTQQGTSRIRIEIPINESQQVDDPNVITSYLVATAKVTFLDNDGNVMFEGKDMVDVGVAVDEANQYVVAFELNESAAKTFATVTSEYVGTAKTISIKLDDEVISTARVSSAITTGKGQITGGFDYESASRLANQIRSGVIPIDMAEIEVRSISATLGEGALSNSIIAGIIGVVLVMAFMIAIYRLSGVVADIALAIYILLVFFALATVPGVQLTLPGIAGIVLAIGMAVDANVIIFERIREEVNAGRSMRTACKNGFKRAFSAILDSNITTIIAAVVLLYFGSGTIQSFAVTLLIGIIASFVAAVFVSRGLLKLFINITDKPALYCRRGGKA